MMPQKTAYQKLHHKWSKRHGEVRARVWEKHFSTFEKIREVTHHFTVGSLSSLMLFALPVGHVQKPLTPTQSQEEPLQVSKSVFLVTDLKQLLPTDMRPLTPQEERQVGNMIQRDTGISVTAEMGGLRLNRSYGYIGAEQHLARYPGDSMATHFDNDADAIAYTSSGMAPGLGAYGYFAPSASEMTEEDKMREKYYIAVQTFLSPDYNEKAREYNEFYKFRKMLVINPQNGKALVAVIGDAGPAAWTGKHLGGSPEVMRYLERFDGTQRGPVLYYFIDDPSNSIPLGPVAL